MPKRMVYIKMTRRQFTMEFKTKIILELLREEQNLSEIATKNGISPNQLRNWKIEFLENATKAFSGSKQEKDARQAERATQEEKQELMAKGGQLMIQNDWLKKNPLKYLDPTTRRNLISSNSEVSIKKQCELLEINRTRLLPILM